MANIEVMTIKTKAMTDILHVSETSSYTIYSQVKETKIGTLENCRQLSLLALVNAFVAAMLGEYVIADIVTDVLGITGALWLIAALILFSGTLAAFRMQEILQLNQKYTRN